MYTSFYHLDSKPFENNPDPSFLWLGEKHKEALAAMRCGIINNNGFLLLTGDAGTGKTTLINALIQSFAKDVKWAVIADPGLERIDFYNAIAGGFGIEKQFTSKVQFLIQFSHFLHKADDENTKVLLLVDDCHRLTQEMLEELRLLSNIEKAETKLINIYYVGQGEFNDMLEQPKNRAVQQRLTLKAELTPLNVNETEDYIRHRLKVAGKVEKLFAAKAIQVIHRYSQGIPGRINVICDHALVAGSIQGNHSIDHKTIEKCVQKLNLPVNRGQEDFASLADDNSDLVSFKEKFVPGITQTPSTISGFNVEGEEKQGSWLKYGLGLLVVLVAGISFWFASQPPLDIAKVDTVVAEQAPVMPDIPQTSSSPAVAMLEKNRSDINEKKAAEIKTAILEKAYRSTENLQTEEVPASQDATEGTGEPVVPASQPVEPASGINGQDDPAGRDTVVGQPVALEETVRIVQVQPLVEQASSKTVMEPVAPIIEEHVDKVAVLETTLPAETGAGDVVVFLKKGPEKVFIAAVAEEPETPQVAQIAPFEPSKVILGLQPDSLDLTDPAANELQSFIEKLKEHPRAKLLVKGFVSSKSNSPKNIELSEKRALSVQKLLIAKGIDAERIEVIGMGNQEPIAPNTTSAGRKKNRRVEIIVISDGL